MRIDTEPLGVPARSSAIPSAAIPRGSSSGDLIMTELPAAKAGAKLRAAKETGKFQGTIWAETP